MEYNGIWPKITIKQFNNFIMGHILIFINLFLNDTREVQYNEIW